MPIKVAFMQLSSCWGCHQSLLNAHLDLLPILPELEIVYWPAVLDFKHESLVARKDGEIIIGFIEGMIRTHQDLENAKLMRKKCQIIVAVGACAVHGGVAGLANLYSKEELVKRKFLEAESIIDAKIPDKHVPSIEDWVVN
jgi:F420-non-reducing hydrogenase small subunit